MCEETMRAPHKLYMYFRLENVVKFLEHHQLKASDPTTFNDPYESHIDFERSMAGFENNTSEYISFPYLDIAEMQADWFERFKNMRIICFCEEETNILMWAYYAEGQKGICIEFDPYEDPLFFRNLHKVRYGSTLETAKVKHNEVNYKDVVLTKAEEWAHEKEWRVFKEDNIDLCTINPQAIKRIIFGCNSAHFKGRETMLATYNKLFQTLQRPEYGHIKYSCIVRDLRRYCLNCQDLPFYVLQEDKNRVTIISLKEQRITILKKESNEYTPIYNQMITYKFEKVTITLQPGFYQIKSNEVDTVIVLQITED